MAITSEHLVGAAVGVGVAAVGFYLYQKNQDKINEFLRSHGLDIPVSDKQPIESMNIEDLATLKERIEDLIAERELAAKQAATEATSAPAEPAQA
ncbi:MAG: hypothetical protein IKC53_10280 [Lentisphaeria bacterium]|jgi:hypothetical protein|nr:hypothetical protein [Lentisphaeria bacterium]MBR2964578.1 hypothetical protein [Lentisphaeria bacterium]MBR3688519.1 hypothetical protein [Lentisphaeria bacterium]